MDSAVPALPLSKLRCRCGNILGAYEAGVLVSRIRRRSGRPRVYREPAAIECEACGLVWQRPAEVRKHGNSDLDGVA